MIYTFFPSSSSKAYGNLADNLCFFHAFFFFFFAGDRVEEGVKLVRALTNVERILGMTAAQEIAEMAIRTWHVERLFH